MRGHTVPHRAHFEDGCGSQRARLESVTMGIRRPAAMERMLATPADAEIILKLYELRTETVMRQARAWMTGEFWPNTADEFFAVAA